MGGGGGGGGGGVNHVQGIVHADSECPFVFLYYCRTALAE